MILRANTPGSVVLVSCTQKIQGRIGTGFDDTWSHISPACTCEQFKTAIDSIWSLTVVLPKPVLRIHIRPWGVASVWVMWHRRDVYGSFKNQNRKEWVWSRLGTHWTEWIAEALSNYLKVSLVRRFEKSSNTLNSTRKTLWLGWLSCQSMASIGTYCVRSWFW